MADHKGVPAAVVPGEVRVVTVEFATELSRALDDAQALLARRTVDLATALQMERPETTTWAQALAYAASVGNVAESHFGLPIEPDADGKYRIKGDQ